MLTPRDTTTDQLAKIIQVLQLGRKTGILSVERGFGTTFEEGMIIFLQGQFLDAKVGRLGSQEGFQWMSTWRECRFSFTPQEPEALAHYTTQARRETNPRQHIPRQIDTQPDLPASRSVPRTQPNLPAQPPEPRMPPQATPVTPPPSPAITNIIPRQIYSVETAMQVIAQTGLSRMHRHVFLLINGQRSIGELIRLTGRQPGELFHILKDLEKIGIIYL